MFRQKKIGTKKAALLKNQLRKNSSTKKNRTILQKNKHHRTVTNERYVTDCTRSKQKNKRDTNDSFQEKEKIKMKPTFMKPI